MKSVNIHGKEYTTVMGRISHLYEVHPNWSIHTELIHRDDDVVVMKAFIIDDNGKCRGIGHAEEFRSASRINQNSAMENCETSAIGRALASIAMSGSDSFASANEVANAISQPSQHLLIHNKLVSDYYENVFSIKEYLTKPTAYNVGMAKANFNTLEGIKKHFIIDGEEIEKSVAEWLWIAPSKGGIFSTMERKFLKNLATEEDYIQEETTNVKMEN